VGFNPARICCRQLHRQWFTIVGGIDLNKMNAIIEACDNEAGA
jgi:hypothetical protein